jgi:hypothetical protein
VQSARSSSEHRINQIPVIFTKDEIKLRVIIDKIRIVAPDPQQYILKAAVRKEFLKIGIQT